MKKYKENDSNTKTFSKLFRTGKEKEFIEIANTKIFSKPFRTGIAIICIAFLVTTTLGAFLLAGIVGVGRSDYNGSITEIYSAEEFVEAISRNSKSGATNKRYEVKSNFTLRQDNIDEIKRVKNRLGEEGAWFFGSMDGHGHTITIDAEMTAPLFEQITQGSSIKQLSFVNAHVVGSQTRGGGIAVVARVNNGTLENILLKNIEVTINNANAAAGLVTYNFGNIIRCVAQVNFNIDEKFITSGGKIDNIWLCRIGTIAANNGEGGRVDGAFVSATFTDKFAVLSMHQYNTNGDRNLLIGYVLGAWKETNLVKDLFVVDGVYTSIAYDFVELGASGISLINSKSIIKSNYISWGNNGWNFSELGGLPTLAIR